MTVDLSAHARGVCYIPHHHVNTVVALFFYRTEAENGVRAREIATGLCRAKRKSSVPVGVFRFFPSPVDGLPQKLENMANVCTFFFSRLQVILLPCIARHV